MEVPPLPEEKVWQIMSDTEAVGKTEEDGFIEYNGFNADDLCIWSVNEIEKERPYIECGFYCRTLCRTLYVYLLCNESFCIVF